MKRIAIAVTLAAVLTAPGGAWSAAPVVHARAEPASVRFGDPFTYTVEARLSPPPTDVRSVAVIADPSPFSALAPAVTERRIDGETAVIRVHQLVACLDRGCLPGRGARTVSTSQVSVRGPGRPLVTAGARIRVEPRVPAAAVEAADGGYRAVTEVPPATTRVGASTATLVIIAGAIVLVALALLLLIPDARLLRSRRPERQHAEPLARALRLLRQSAARPPSDRRRAADLLARLLGARGDDAHAPDAVQMAWARPEPQPADALRLADEVERSSGGQA